MKKYGISSFLVINSVNPDDSPRLTSKNHKKIIRGILTQRDINSHQFDDEIVSDYMTPIEKLIYY